jgi:HipA-like protein
MLRTVQATRYVTPLREGGSLPAIVEASDLGLYVLKFRSAGQGPLALVAELVAGEIGRRLGLKVPELVLMEVDETLGRNERDEEIQDLLRASVGLNLAMDYLPGSVMFDPAAGDIAPPDLASQIVWFDAFVTNVDRTAYNANLLLWHRNLYPIDHGAAMYFHHDWKDLDAKARTPFTQIRQHLLLRDATKIREAGEIFKPLLTEASLTEIVTEVPDAWLTPEPGVETPDAKRAAYVRYFSQRLEAASIFVEEAIRAHAQVL